MPFRSQAQRAWMHINKPEMAKKWEKHTPKGKKLPKRVKSESLINRIDAKLLSPVNIHLKRDFNFSERLERALENIHEHNH
jgi:hypothetical protein